MFVIGTGYVILLASRVDPLPSSSADLLFGLWLLALVPVVQQASDSTPLYEQLGLGDG